jgi:hypothetical protein
MGLKEIVLVGTLFGAQLSGSAAANVQASGNHALVTDPVFGITFNSSEVKYEPMPVAARHLCPDFRRGVYWTFAHFRKNDADYFVVLGAAPNQDGDSFGTAIEIRGSKCQVADSKWMLSGFLPPRGYSGGSEWNHLPGLEAPEVCDQGDCHYVLRSAGEEALLRGLVQDALARGTRAWGGMARFKKEVCSPQIMEDSSSMPVVQQELSNFCRQP